MSVGHARNLIGKPVSKFEGLVVQEFERVDGARLNDVLSERLDLAAIAVQARRNPTLPLNLHGIINVNRLAIEKHFASIGLRQRLCIIKAYILNEFLAQLRTENVPVRIDDGSGCFGLSHLDLLEVVDEIALTIGSTGARFVFFFVSAEGFISMFSFFRGGDQRHEPGDNRRMA
jgi:hypothetical protein